MTEEHNGGDYDMTHRTGAEAPPECKTEGEKQAFAFGWWKAMQAQRDPLPADAITVNLVRLAGLDKHKARECEAIVRQVLAAHGVTVGGKFVPLEPLPSMVEAGEQLMGDGFEYLVPEIYRAMVNAAAGVGASVPPGWKLVPMEPTDAMFHAAEKNATRVAVDAKRRGSDDTEPGYCSTYKAMLAAAPAHGVKEWHACAECVYPDACAERKQCAAAEMDRAHGVRVGDLSPEATAKLRPCPDCSGTGIADNTANLDDCKLCGGTGSLGVKVPQPTALERFNRDPDLLANETPLERLRYFLSLALNGQDWLDVEPFLDALGVATPHPDEFTDLTPFKNAAGLAPPDSGLGGPGWVRDASGVAACEPCPRGADKPEPTCTNRAQCWEPCGLLGNDEKHVRVASAKDTDALNKALGVAASGGWHAPGIGEVHNADHSLMLFCTKANPDEDAHPDYLPDDELARRVAALLNADGVPEVDPSSLEQRLREWANSLPAGTLGAVHLGTLMSVARGVEGSDGEVFHGKQIDWGAVDEELRRIAYSFIPNAPPGAGYIEAPLSELRTLLRRVSGQ